MTKKKKGDMDWLRLESRIREVLRNFREHAADVANPGNLAWEYVHRISDILGEETGRGYELPDIGYLRKGEK